jgi:hypothetical protein
MSTTDLFAHDSAFSYGFAHDKARSTIRRGAGMAQLVLDSSVARPS